MRPMELTAPKQRHSVAQYLERERTSVDKHEYRNGEIVMMAGGSDEHSLIIANVIRHLGNALDGKPCRVYDSNLRVRIPRTGLYTYPDVSVICSRPEPDPNDPSGETTINPRLIVEVLSPSTETYDRTEKFRHYLQLDSLQEYVLVSQISPRIETYFRQAGGNWLFSPASGLQSSAQLRSIDLALSLTAVYAGVEFPPPAAVPNGFAV
jgi:Uma2 family endonuclease